MLFSPSAKKFYDSAHESTPDDAIDVSSEDHEWCIATLNSGGSFDYVDGKFVDTSSENDEKNAANRKAAAWVKYRQSAQAALDKSDITLWRCYEYSVKFPIEWVDYRTALRGIVSSINVPDGDLPESLPAMPSYPEGA